MVAIVTALVLLFSGPASADNVDKLVKDLATGSDYKLRLSSAASLAKLGGDKAIKAFIAAVTGKKADKEKTVRGAAAVGLGKVVTSETSEDLKKKALTALLTASKKDKDSFVKKQAKKAYDKIKKLDDEAVTVASGGVYLNIGPMSSKTGGNDADLMKQMRSTAEKAVNKNAKAFVTKWPGGKEPKEKDLTAKSISAFYLDGTLNEITEVQKSGGTKVSCKVSMLIATFPDKSMFGFLNGSAAVQASNDAADIDAAKVDCVNAVVEDLVIKKIIPTIQAKAGP